MRSRLACLALVTCSWACSNDAEESDYTLFGMPSTASDEGGATGNPTGNTGGGDGPASPPRGDGSGATPPRGDGSGVTPPRGDDGAEAAADAAVEPRVEALTFGHIHEQIIKKSCAGALCHVGELLPAVGLSLNDEANAYKTLTENGPQAGASADCGDKFVVPGDPDASVLIMLLEGSCGAQMPQDAEPLPADTIAGIRAWVEAGAPND